VQTPSRIGRSGRVWCFSTLSPPSRHPGAQTDHPRRHPGGSHPGGIARRGENIVDTHQARVAVLPCVAFYHPLATLAATLVVATPVARRRDSSSGGMLLPRGSRLVAPSWVFIFHVFHRACKRSRSSKASLEQLSRYLQGALQRVRRSVDVGPGPLATMRGLMRITR
jgi:hypothetical protein